MREPRSLLRHAFGRPDDAARRQSRFADPELPRAVAAEIALEHDAVSDVDQVARPADARQRADAAGLRIPNLLLPVLADDGNKVARMRIHVEHLDDLALDRAGEVVVELGRERMVRFDRRYDQNSSHRKPCGDSPRHPLLSSYIGVLIRLSAELDYSRAAPSASITAWPIRSICSGSSKPRAAHSSVRAPSSSPDARSRTGCGSSFRRSRGSDEARWRAAMRFGRSTRRAPISSIRYSGRGSSSAPRS